MRVIALLTCFNRREITLECLRGLAAQTLPGNVDFKTVLVDDGSTDGTREAILKSFRKPMCSPVTGRFIGAEE